MYVSIHLHSNSTVRDNFAEGENMNFFLNSDIVIILLKTKWGRERRLNFVIFVVWSALIVRGWVVVGWSRKSCLGPAEISFFCVPGLIQDEGRRVSLRFRLFISDLNQGNKDFESKNVGSRFFSVVPWMERFSLDLRSGKWDVVVCGIHSRRLI